MVLLAWQVPALEELVILATRDNNHRAIKALAPEVASKKLLVDNAKGKIMRYNTMGKPESRPRGWLPDKA